MTEEGLRTLLQLRLHCSSQITQRELPIRFAMSTIVDALQSTVPSSLKLRCQLPICHTVPLDSGWLLSLYFCTIEQKYQNVKATLLVLLVSQFRINGERLEMAQP